MADVEGARTALELQRSLEELPGIRGARVDIEGPNVKIVRVLVVPERSTDQTITDIRKTSSTHHRLDIEPEAIEVLRVAEVVSGNGRPRRRKLSSIATERSGDRFHARVVLELSGDVLVGESDSPSERSFELRSVAKATLHSLRELLNSPVDLESVQIVGVGTERLSIVTLDRSGQILVGSALVKLDEHDSIARATLDAMNRAIGGPLEGHDMAWTV